MKTFRLERSGEMLLDIGSYARPGPQSQVHLTPAQVAQIHRTVSRVPEVVIKVTSGGGATDSGGVRRHLDYIGRNGELSIEMDDGDQLQSRGAELRLIEDWDLDLEQHRKRPGLTAIDRRSAPKLVHRLCGAQQNESCSAQWDEPSAVSRSRARFVTTCVTLGVYECARAIYPLACGFLWSTVG